MTLDVLLVGHLTRDRLLINDVETQRVGGAVYYGAFPLQQMAKKVGVITKVAAKDHELLEEFKQANIPVIVRPSQETTEMTIIHLTKEGDRRKFLVGSVADPFSMDDFADVSAPIIHICPLIHGEISAASIEHLGQRARLGLDAQGFIRYRNGQTLEFADWDEKKKVLAWITFLKVDQGEAELLTGMKDKHQAAEWLASLGPQEVIVTHKDGVLLYANGHFHSAPFRTQNLAGRTGRGDTCMASYLGRRMTHSAEEACRFAAAVVSAKLEKPGPFKGDLSSEQAIQRTLRAYL